LIDKKYIQEHPRKEFFSVFFAICIIFVVYGLLYILNDWQWTGTSASGYCEKVSETTWIREPTNTISNLAFVFVGLYILWLAQYDPTEGKPSLSTRSWFLILYGISCVAVGMGSFAMHGFNTGWGGWLDVTGMMMYISMPVFYNFSRFLRWSEKEFVSYYLGANVIFAILLWQYSLLTFLWGALIGIWISQELALKYQKQPYVIFLLPTLIILFLFLYTSPGSTPIDFVLSEFEAILLWAALAFFLYKIEDIKLERTHTPYFWAGFASYFLATIIWQPSKTDGVLCDPDSLMQGHALWHILGAVSMWCFYKYFRTEVDNY
jgi:hypothetical protein